MPQHRHSLGYHWIMDLHGCPFELLDDLNFVRTKLVEVTERFGLTLLSIQDRQFAPQGVTALGFLAESHLSIHTWPEHNYAAVDIFTCGSDMQLKAACEFIARAVQARETSVVRICRGVPGDSPRGLTTESVPLDLD
ncbi:MAG: adenosylmethionine decarboxylase [Planctomycetota bacterium]|jgi:S-adenosylmethionine decarboxylase